MFVVVENVENSRHDNANAKRYIAGIERKSDHPLVLLQISSCYSDIVPELKNPCSTDVKVAKVSSGSRSSRVPIFLSYTVFVVLENVGNSQHDNANAKRYIVEIERKSDHPCSFISSERKRL